MIDINKAPTERNIPRLDATEREILEYAQIALVIGNDKHRSDVAKLIAAWLGERK